MANVAEIPQTLVEHSILLERLAVARLAIRSPAKTPNERAIQDELKAMHAESVHDGNALPRLASAATAKAFLTKWGVRAPKPDTRQADWQ